MHDLDKERINKTIADRSNVFYWQTDRAVEPEEAGAIWADRHNYFTDSELFERINAHIGDVKLKTLSPFDPNDQTNLGNVSSVRSGILENGESVIIRSFPKGVKNGYFHVESLVADTVRSAGLPSYETIAIHDMTDLDDLSFHVIQKLPDPAVKTWLNSHPEDEDNIVFQVGKTMAAMHKITVDGFGPFSNELAKHGTLKGLHDTFVTAQLAGLDFNLDVLVKANAITAEQATKIKGLFTADNPLLQIDQAVLVHNDFADWNQLTDGKTITGIIDFDEAVGGDPISDIACWSTFFNPSRLEHFLEGYWNNRDKPADYEAKFELFRLRYTVSKMTLRIRRYSWDPSEAIKQRIQDGTEHLAASMKYFGF